MKKSIPIHIADESTRVERSDAVANRQRILAVAKELFAAQGPTAVNMSDIVQAANIGRGTLYRHFPNKGELCLALIDEQIADFQNEALGLLRQMTADEQTAVAKLIAFLDALVTFTEAHTPLLREAQRQGVHYFDNKVTPQYWQHATVTGLLQTAVAQGELSPNINTIYLADLLLAALNAQLFHFQREERGLTPEEISANIRQLVLQLRLG
ncbi:TetR/AcrR family transcriptional regulator [Candidatus Leptofilum sp.]|uniref:TetR/AcrR family transcriptional regulator n=1 Tax=Candidatus Leptofilum sp. TaxID=3241576 RepID=UPI003B58DED3